MCVFACGLVLLSGLGHTDDAIDVSGAKVFEKTKFSMVIPAVEEVMKSEFERKSIVLFGIEVRSIKENTTTGLKYIYLSRKSSIMEAFARRANVLKTREL